MAKHNKKRNTMFIYETLLREVVKQSINKDQTKRNIAIRILKEHFRKNTELRCELDLYKTLLETQGLSEKIAERLITETTKQHSRINQQKLFKEQSAIISVINKEISPSVFSNFVPNYKDLATISQIFSDNAKPKNKVLLENKLIKKLSQGRPPATTSTPVSNLVIKNFVKRFNDGYGELFEEQKELLSKYIGSFLDEGTEFNFYLNEEIGRLKSAVSLGFADKAVKDDTMLENKLQEVKSLLGSFNKAPIDKDGMMRVLKIQALARELQ
jgi:hypothetical protein